MPTVFTSDIEPRQGESYAQFVQRAHYALMDECPDWMDRNERVWAEWEMRVGEPLRERAKKYLPSSQYRFVPNVCYFSEHETIGRDGKPVRYSLKELCDIMDEQNSRADRHNYSAIISKHTIDNAQLPEHLEPKVLGHVGAARLGMVGNQNPQWALFFDEHHKTDSYSQKVLAEKQRRSVEVNRYRDGMRRPYFDPVAALGADSPRLPLPVARYADDDAIVDRYSVVAPAQVSGSNSFIPGFDKKPTQYSEQGSMSPQDIDAIVQAIRGTPEMQWVTQQMGQAAGGSPAGPDGGDNQSPVAPPPPPAPAGGDGGTPLNGPQPQGQYMAQPQQPQLPRYAASEGQDKELVERYSELSERFEELSERYSKLNEANIEIMKKHGETRLAVIELERRECDKDRELQIKELYSKYPHFVDVDEELDRCLYSRGSEMGVDQFEKHVVDVERYAQRSSPVTRMVPAGALPPPESDKARYEERLSEAIVERYSRYEAKGDIRGWDELREEITKEWAANGKP